MSIEKFTEWIGDETHPDKPQYFRGVACFTCPQCGRKISSAGYLNFGYFQIAAATHLRECDSAPPQPARAACSRARAQMRRMQAQCDSALCESKVL